MATKAGRPTATDPTKDLEADHRQAEALFEKLTSAKAPAARLKVFLQLKEALDLHATLEEAIFYPAVKTLPDDEARALVSEAMGEHDEVKALLAVLEASPPDAPFFLSNCLALKEAVAHHVEEEEGEMFPRARRLLGAERLKGLGARMAAARKAKTRRKAKPAKSE